MKIALCEDRSVFLDKNTSFFAIIPPRGIDMHAAKDTKQKILHRLKIARGHLDKVISMVEDDTYCIDILHQSQAIQSALKQTDNLILKNHLENCVVNTIKEGKTEKTIEEIMKVFERNGGK